MKKLLTKKMMMTLGENTVLRITRAKEQNSKISFGDSVYSFANMTDNELKARPFIRLVFQVDSLQHWKNSLIKRIPEKNNLQREKPEFHLCRLLMIFPCTSKQAQILLKRKECFR